MAEDRIGFEVRLVDLDLDVARGETVDAEEAVIAGRGRHDQRAVRLTDVDDDILDSHFSRVEEAVVVEVREDPVTDGVGTVEAQVDREVRVVIARGSVAGARAEVTRGFVAGTERDHAGGNAVGERVCHRDAVVISVAVCVRIQLGGT